MVAKSLKNRASGVGSNGWGQSGRSLGVRKCPWLCQRAARMRAKRAFQSSMYKSKKPGELSRNATAFKKALPIGVSVLNNENRPKVKPRSRNLVTVFIPAIFSLLQSLRRKLVAAPAVAEACWEDSLPWPDCHPSCCLWRGSFCLEGCPPPPPPWTRHPPQPPSLSWKWPQPFAGAFLTLEAAAFCYSYCSLLRVFGVPSYHP